MRQTVLTRRCDSSQPGGMCSTPPTEPCPYYTKQSADNVRNSNQSTKQRQISSFCSISLLYQFKLLSIFSHISFVCSISLPVSVLFCSISPFASVHSAQYLLPYQLVKFCTYS